MRKINFGKNCWMKKAVVILSGGLDSTILLHQALKKYKEVIAVSFDFKQKYIKNKDPQNIMFQNNVVELIKAKETCKELKVKHYVIDVSFLNSTLKFMQNDKKRFNSDLIKTQPKTCMPFRNMILLSAALGIAELEQVDYILTGYQTQDKHGYWDTTESFVKAVNKVAKLNPSCNVKILAPYAKLNKSDEIIIGRNLNVNFTKTWSCYNPLKIDKQWVCCNCCPACKDRKFNFEKLNTCDDLPYWNNKTKEIDYPTRMKKWANYRKQIKKESEKGK